MNPPEEPQAAKTADRLRNEFLVTLREIDRRAHRAMDVRGFRVAVQAGAEFDAIFHFGPGNEEIRQIQKERGLRGAIKWYEEK